MVDIVASYTAADTFPVKLAQDWDTIRKIVEKGFIPPTHLQLLPTNKCTRRCSFCSCSERDKSFELDLDTIVGLADDFARLGCKGVTITGGGEPTTYDYINEVIAMFVDSYGIKAGMVCNGDLLHELWRVNDLTWCRLSCSDEQEFGGPWWESIKEVVEQAKNCSFSFSYVMGRNPNVANINRYIEAAEQYSFSHVRVVSNIIDYENVPIPYGIKDSPIVALQRRDDPQPGAKRCWISLLKPLVGADGWVWPCCGVMYCRDPQAKDMPVDMRMCLVSEATAYWKEQYPFDGSRCIRCYYSAYNNYLDILKRDVVHREFV